MSSEKKQKLTKAELRRKETFEKMAEGLAAEGYTQKILKLNFVELNVLTLLIAIPFMIPFLAAFRLFGNELNIERGTSFIAVIAFLALIVVHELLHGIAFSHFASNGWKSVSFGFNVKYCCPYCNCLQPLKKKPMIICALLPTIVLGFGFGIAAVISGSSLLLLISCFNIAGGGGDLFIILKVLLYKTKCKDVLFIDHPYEIGTAVFER
jgi:hypothetical protein